MSEADMKPPGMRPHGKQWRIRKRVPKDVRHHYQSDFLPTFYTGPADEQTARVLCWAKLAEWEADFQRLRDTSSARRTSIDDAALAQLVAKMQHSMLSMDEEMRVSGSYLDDFQYERTQAWLTSASEAVRMELGRGVFGASVDIALDWLNGHGYDIPQDSPEFRRVVMEFAKAYAEALKVKRTRNAGEWVATPPAPLEPLQAAPADTLKLSAVVDTFVKRVREAKEMAAVYQAVMPVFLEIVGDKPVSKLLQKDIEDFFEVVCRLPKRWDLERKRQGLSLRELAAMDWPQCLSPKTFKARYRSTVSAFLKESIRVYRDQGFPAHLTTEGVEYSGTRKAGERQQRALTAGELVRLFAGPEYREFAADPAQAHRYWLPLLGLFTGARINELCQLNPQNDIREEGGIWFIDITEEGEADEGIRRSVKTAGSRRCVPLHSELIRLGFLQYVARVKQAGHKRLFPKFPPKGDKASGTAEVWFRRFLEGIGLRDTTAGAAVVGFHCFRSTFLNRAMNLGELSAHWLTGHIDTQVAATVRNYRGSLELPKKREILERIFYDLQIPPPLHGALTPDAAGGPLAAP